MFNVFIISLYNLLHNLGYGRPVQVVWLDYWNKVLR